MDRPSEWQVVGTSMGDAMLRVSWDGLSDPTFSIIGWKFDGPEAPYTYGQLLIALARWLEAEGVKQMDQRIVVVAEIVCPLAGDGNG